MDITTYALGLEEKLKGIVGLGKDDLISVGRVLTQIRGVVGELKEFTTSYRFESAEEEIQFFKHRKPIFLSQYYFHKRKFELLFFDAFRDEVSRLENHRRVMIKLEHFSRKHYEFYQYCLSGSTCLDHQYFTRSQNVYLSVCKDQQFLTRCDLKLAKILAVEMTRDFIRRKVASASSTPSSNFPVVLEWTSPKIALIELIYALHAGGAFNHGKAELKQIVEVFQRNFSVDLGNYARSFGEIKIRKSGSAAFLEFLRDRLLTQIDQ